MAASSIAASPMVDTEKPADGLTFAIVAPSGSVDPDLLARGVGRLQSRGARVLVHEQCLKTWRYFAGTDVARVQAIHDVANDPAIDVVMAARGGYGLTRILDDIDWDWIAAGRKVWCGFSDFTAFNWAAFATRQFVTLHGPMLTSDFGGTPDAHMEQWFWPLLRGQPVDVDVVDAEAELEAPVRGRVWGGNLAVLSRLLGTRYDPLIDGGILFLEDIHEEPYALERMFYQLQHQGVLATQSAVVLGDFTSCVAKNSQRYAYSLAEAIESLRAISPIPILSQFPLGHLARKATLPIGSMASIAPTATGYQVRLQVDA
jgi:muramoyltetrapeptide carboxypeptidase